MVTVTEAAVQAAAFTPEDRAAVVRIHDVCDDAGAHDFNATIGALLDATLDDQDPEVAEWATGWMQALRRLLNGSPSEHIIGMGQDAYTYTLVPSVAA